MNGLENTIMIDCNLNVIDGNLNAIGYAIDHQTYDERMEFASWFSRLDEHTPDYIASALSSFSQEFDWTMNLIEDEND